VGEEETELYFGVHSVFDQKERKNIIEGKLLHSGDFRFIPSIEMIWE
jgi:hypothetical protein